jgi:amphi-Trp domain-containing protein
LSRARIFGRGAFFFRESVDADCLRAPPRARRLSAPPIAAKFPSPTAATTMSEEKIGRDVEKVYSTGQFVEKLRRLADALEAGEPFTIQVASQRLKVPATAKISVEHEQEGADHELEFQLTWSESDD